MQYYKLLKKELKLRSYAKRTIQSYVRSVRQLQNFYCPKDLSEITEEELKDYWLVCREEFEWSHAYLRISKSGIKHFFTYVLRQDWEIFDNLKFQREETLPTVLSIQEVRCIIEALPAGQNRTFFSTVYSLGLRVSEATALKVKHINSDRMQVHVHCGKGARDRVIPLPETTLFILRKYWKTHHHPVWLFPALGYDGRGGPTAEKHVPGSTVRGALRRTVKKMGFRKNISPHTFRHSYATHLLESGVPIRHVQENLGHKTLQSTMVYLHVTTSGRIDSSQQINRLMKGVLS